MSLERAEKINKLLVQAFVAQTCESDPPSLQGISLDDCLAATELLRAQPPRTNADGGRTHYCFVEPTRIPRLYAWAIVAQ